MTTVVCILLALACLWRILTRLGRGEKAQESIYHTAYHKKEDYNETA